MQRGNIDTEIARHAVRRAMERLEAHNLRAWSVNVMDAAARLLEEEHAGQVSFLEAIQFVKTAVVAMGEAGELEWHIDPRRDWRLMGRAPCAPCGASRH